MMFLALVSLVFPLIVVECACDWNWESDNPFIFWLNSDKYFARRMQFTNYLNDVNFAHKRIRSIAPGGLEVSSPIGSHHQAVEVAAVASNLLALSLAKKRFDRYGFNISF